MAGAAETEPSPGARYEALIRISNSLRAHKEPQGLFEILVRELRNVIPFDAIAQFDESANKVHWHLCSGGQAAEGWQADTAEELPRLICSAQEPLLLETLDGDLQFTRHLRDAGIQSLCAFPLTTAQRRLGSLVICSTRPSAYPPEELRFCSLAAQQIALAIDDATNTVELRAARKGQERLQLLLDLTTCVVSSLNLRDVLREIAAQVRRVMHCDVVGVVLPNPEDGGLRLYALDYGDAGSPVEEGHEPPRAAHIVRALAGEVAILRGEELDHPLARQAGIRSLAHFPMKARSGVVGILALGTHDEHAFPPDDVPFLSQVANRMAIAVENALAYGDISDQKQRLTSEKLYLEDEIRSELGFEEIVGRSEALRLVLEQVRTVAPTDSTVLIYGETGTGKELIARAVHNLSARKTGSFVKLNCAATPTGLLESEMFGQEKGAFIRANMPRIGRFELANRGTMFLDEIGEIPLELQPKLLRVLEEREFERLGSSRTLHTDARLIAATNRDLEALVKKRKFRSDLFYRLKVFPVRVPALRDRREDIPLLVRHFVQQFSRKRGKAIDAIPAETMSALARYPWPGNVRELQNVIERAMILSTGHILTLHGEDLHPPDGAPSSSGFSASASPAGNMRDTLEQSEREQILAALEKSNWKLAGPDGAAARLGLKRSTLQSRMRKFGIRISRTVA